MDNVEAARCVLLAQHQIPLKDFTTCRKKPENRGGLYPVWGYPWVLPENFPSWSSCEGIFWAWIETLKYSPTELQELREVQNPGPARSSHLVCPLGQQAAAAKGHPEAGGF
ncbi:hypothetical protein L917_17197 [Phytophthora nicotianae]|uniref:Uncharacterized protein n=1 Tax=Phytophthora nicotianae TaxID=4792 RepID=W2NMF1_PHYNI|nr:hypothetical protein L917_17197 [Phytophthora nicotianae]ETM48854.1 hypothetical protein L914_06674 [Phytophthora nicotianae]